MLRSLRLRLLLFCGGFLLVTVVVLGIWWKGQQGRLENISRAIAVEQHAHVENILKLDYRSLFTFVTDHASHEDLLRSLTTRNPAWAQENLKPRGQTFGFDAVWIIAPGGDIVYQNQVGTAPSLPIQALAALFRTRPDVNDTHHAYFRDGDQVIELLAAPIARRNAPQRSFGQLVVGRTWDALRIVDLQKSLGGTLRLSPTRSASTNSSGTDILVSIPLEPAIGAIPTFLEGDFRIELGDDIAATARDSVALVVGFLAVFALSIAFCISRWIGAPLASLARAIRDQDGERLADLQKSSGDMDEIAALLLSIFGRKQVLQQLNEELVAKEEARLADLQAITASYQSVENRLQTVLTNTPVTIFAIDRHAIITLVEGQGLSAIRRKAGRYQGKSALRLVRSRPDLADGLTAALRQQEAVTMSMALRGITFDVHLRPTFDLEGDFTGLLGLMLDVTERQGFESELRHQALHDSLTGLPNRVRFRECLDLALRNARDTSHTITVLFLDLDNFKWVNDALGHEIGDRLLVAVADRLRTTLGQNGIIARISGDEFTILLNENESGLEESVSSFADRLSIVLRKEFTVGNHTIHVNGSIGIAQCVGGEKSVSTMLRHADVAMYHAKSQGKGCWALFDTTMEKDMRERIEMESELRDAATHDQLAVYYQPIVRLSDNAIVGVEALLRWKHPQHGLLAPGRFIKIAEETGTIIGLDYWTLRTAGEEVRRWNEAHPDDPLFLSVNMSAKQMKQPLFVEIISRLLTRTGLAPSALKLEITESMMMEDPRSAALLLHELKALGISISIDDFGTGYSSLTYLSMLPIDTLKIDQSFVRRITDHHPSLSIVQAIQRLASALGYDVVCEGIETEAQFDALYKMGCTYGQGYLFSRPVPFHVLLGTLESDEQESDEAAALEEPRRAA